MIKQSILSNNDINYTFTLSQISHEINNPLTLIYSTIQLLSLKHPELDKDDLWSQLLSDVDYLKQLTVSLSSYTHGSSLNIKNTDLRYLLHDIKSSWLPTANQAGKQLLFHISDNLPSIDCDSIKLKQCLFNLIKNSFEATSANDTIEITAFADSSSITMTVSDTGDGLDEAQIKHIFEPFTTYKSGGHGLGLAITEKIIKAHHGTIQVSSQKDKGTCFAITLPIIQTNIP